MISRRSSWIAALLTLAAATPAAAHSPIAGIGNFYSGAAHPFVAPAHLIALISFGLLVGQGARRTAAGTAAPPDEPTIVAFAAALALGLTLHRLAGDPDTDRMLLSLGAAAGLGVALARATPPWLLRLFALAIGGAMALASGPGAIDGSARWASLAGTGFGALLGFAYVVLITRVANRHPAARIAVRVAGSWLAAAALLVIALSFAPARVAAITT